MSDLERAREVFEHARGLEGRARGEYIRSACKSDLELGELVQNLLNEDDERTLSVWSDPDCDRDHQDAPTLPVGTQVASYKIIGLIGVGGMGAVYAAEQDRPQRDVALKLIRPGFATTRLLKRFELEAEVLGRLHHSGIAAIHEAGIASTPHGDQPFFAMELIDGDAITDYANKRGIGVRERLALLAQVCEAVQHAHQHGVIHRDLKPSNILVSAEGQPKVLDFGVARATDSDIQSTTIETQMGQLIGTVPYMSPEQAGGDPNELDSRSDVYALGVIAYELLAGELPHDLSNKVVLEAVRVIREDDPTPLSAVNRLYRGDIGTIVHKAMEKDKDRRYQSADELALDIRRYLADETIAAHRPSTLYQIKKFSRRNRVFVGGVACTIAVLFLGAVTSSLLLARALVAERNVTTERDTAQENLRRAEALSNFVRNDILRAADPRGEPSLSVREALDRAAARVGTEFEGVPLVEAEIRRTIASSYFGLGLFEAALDQLRPARALLVARLGEDDLQTARVDHQFGQAHTSLGEHESAAEILPGAIEIMRRHLDSADPELLAAEMAFPVLWVSMGRLDEAEEFYRDLIQRCRQVGDEALETEAMCLANLGQVYGYRQQFDQAVAWTEEAIPKLRLVFGEDHPRLVIAMSNLVFALAAMGEMTRAEDIAKQNLSLARSVYPSWHDQIGLSHEALGYVLLEQERYVEAAEEYRQAYEIRRPALGLGHDELTITALCYASACNQSGHLDQSEAVLIETLEVVPADNPFAGHLRAEYGRLRRLQNRYSEAEPLLREAVAMMEPVFGPQDPNFLDAVREFVLVLRALGNEEEAMQWEARLPSSSP